MTKYRAEMTTTPIAIFRGDVVNLRASGQVSSDVTGTGSDATIGVAANYVAAASANDLADIFVYDDPDTIFEIQSDGTTDPGALTTAEKHIGSTADVNVATDGTVASGRSNDELDYSSITTTTNQPLKIVGIYDIVGNDPTLKNERYLVTLQMHVSKDRKAI